MQYIYLGLMVKYDRNWDNRAKSSKITHCIEQTTVSMYNWQWETYKRPKPSLKTYISRYISWMLSKSISFGLTSYPNPDPSTWSASISMNTCTQVLLISPFHVVCWHLSVWWVEQEKWWLDIRMLREILVSTVILSSGMKGKDRCHFRSIDLRSLAS